MTDRPQPPSSDKPRAPRIQSWHAETPEDRAPAIFGADARIRRLCRLVPLWPSEIASSEPAQAERVVAALERALRAERRRGRAGHWSYDMNRHTALSHALRDERARLEALRRGASKQIKPCRWQANRRMETKALSISTV